MARRRIGRFIRRQEDSVIQRTDNLAAVATSSDNKQQVLLKINRRADPESALRDPHREHFKDWNAWYVDLVLMLKNEMELCKR